MWLLLLAQNEFKENTHSANKYFLIRQRLYLFIFLPHVYNIYIYIYIYVCVCVCVCVNEVYYLPTPPLGQDMTQGQF